MVAGTPSWTTWDQPQPMPMPVPPVPTTTYSPNNPNSTSSVRSHSVTSPGNSDGRHYPSPEISPGDWNVASPTSFASYHYPGAAPRSVGSSNSSNAFGSPNTGPAKLQQLSPSSQSTSSMSSYSTGTYSPNPAAAVAAAAAAAAPPSLPANLGHHEQQEQPRPHPQQPQSQPKPKQRCTSADVGRIQKRFMVKTSLDEGREKVANRRALDLIDAVAGSNHAPRRSSSTIARATGPPNLKELTARASAQHFAADNAPISTTVVTSSNSSGDILVVKAQYHRPRSNTSSSKSSTPSSAVAKEQLATSTWSRKKNKEEAEFRETVHDYKTSMDRERESWAQKQALHMLQPDRVPGAA